MDEFDMMAEMAIWPWLDLDTMCDNYEQNYHIEHLDDGYDYPSDEEDDDYGPDGKYYGSIESQIYDEP